MTPPFAPRIPIVAVTLLNGQMGILAVLLSLPDSVADNAGLRSSADGSMQDKDIPSSQSFDIPIPASEMQAIDEMCFLEPKNQALERYSYINPSSHSFSRLLQCQDIPFLLLVSPHKHVATGVPCCFQLLFV